MNERRKEERRILQLPLCSDVTISSIHQQEVFCGSLETCIKDISIHGLRCISPLRFPINDNFVLRFQTRIMDTVINLDGSIAWRKDNSHTPGIYEYGIQLHHDEFSSAMFTKLFNDMGSWLKSSSFVPGCRFCVKETCPLYPSQYKIEHQSKSASS
ncbi:PilZ domain-containing protein [Aneurinibacillus uraniidurans]|uniref:PilZ domain-containing protein n=1 Tax=Aneurinibacillus uraniidurans TaxID=2966586 RepID=UPI00234AC232|nr:PilZ domain-containing protein [Aneurinibacillus sp. B1]WCN38235.1 PilZ domain-containing protein [Aneurinibacillus sp. B1]